MFWLYSVPPNSGAIHKTEARSQQYAEDINIEQFAGDPVCRFVGRALSAVCGRDF